ncbi:MAG: 16S rRNA (adenine(1518)-N(6)/adenine(1519)-N(6))-dimethyltransferase RsmA [Anaerolineae bacterium]|nr:16S rRNA (adenine(1518)-N(6)/adenine(1519)-N(6))-dimethyltransferase RsmA [Anaerolineae bacterium]
MTNPKRLLDSYGINPKKSLGQNFLHDPNALDKIIRAAELKPEETVLEIGPGTGALTDWLASVARRVIAVELDDRLIPLLQYRFSDYPNVTLVHANILEVNLALHIRPDEPYCVVANLPYYITSAILRYLFEQPHKARRLVVMVQNEVADRLVAPPGDLSLLGVSVQYYGRPRIIARLSPAIFWPRPDVTSALVRIDTYADGERPVQVADEAQFFHVVKAGFSQKRKQLVNALSAGLGIDKEATAALLTAAGIAPTRRAETLTLAEWAALANQVRQFALPGQTPQQQE